jgi:hypothetical protein
MLHHSLPSDIVRTLRRLGLAVHPHPTILWHPLAAHPPSTPVSVSTTRTPSPTSGTAPAGLYPLRFGWHPLPPIVGLRPSALCALSSPSLGIAPAGLVLPSVLRLRMLRDIPESARPSALHRLTDRHFGLPPPLRTLHASSPLHCQLYLPLPTPRLWQALLSLPPHRLVALWDVRPTLPTLTRPHRAPYRPLHGLYHTRQIPPRLCVPYPTLLLVKMLCRCGQRS